ncbi:MULTISPECIES: ribonuclease Z [unclassified Roseivirga]|uniref:ribonuclease Z n=1 Tax=unclassified Roseivirga TaxID=2626142 RepID=UPI00257E08ED|nr:MULTISPECIES: ribonuclease Z [unclassified Roseivirga]MEC7754829.1 ribonuclease Z [Bacteroidota bacterium]
MSIRVKILGSSSATPAHRRNHTSQLVNVEGKYYLVDCGEGTQLQLKRYKLRAQRINNIFISHLHGDHYLGLMGLLSTMHLMGRNKPLNLYGPRGLAEIITLQLRYSETIFNYDLKFIEVDASRSQVIHEDELICVHSIPLNHRIPCSGFLFEEKTKNRRIRREMLPDDMSVRNIIRLKKGEDIYAEDGTLLYKNKDMTLPPRQSFRYAYCSDTKYDESIIPIIEGADMLYHEATFLEEHLDRATSTYHSTAKEAATIAQKANVGKLLLGHFSARYKELEPLEAEAREVFAESYLAIEGEEFILDS